MKIFQPKTVSANLSTAELAKAIDSPDTRGILLVKDLPKAPFAEIRAAFDGLTERPDLAARLNSAYTKNLVHKDSFAVGNGGPTVDMKRVLDLSPERLETIRAKDPDLVVLHEGSLAISLEYWDRLKTDVAPKMVRAVAQAIGSAHVAQDAALNYRMVDYYERNSSDDHAIVAPRCGDHRDFGSFTLVFPSHAGFQVFLEGAWRDIAPIEEGTAILLFGWCTQIRSNGRIPAILHRVTDTEGVVRRTAAVLFCAPKRPETSLEPVVRPGEEPLYISGIQAGQLRGKMCRKWQKREGTLSPENQILEEEEILATNLYTQDDVVNTMTTTTTAAVAN